MLKDIRYAARMLAKTPTFTAVAVCSLAVGIGANSAIFSFADALLLRPLPVLKPSAVSTVLPMNASAFGVSTGISYPDYADLREHNRTFQGLVAFSYATYGYSADAATVPEMKFGLFVSGNFFRVLGVEPALGRDFRDQEDKVAGRDPVVVLSHDLWVSEFNSKPSAAGSKLRLNGIEFTVVGIAPEHFTGVDVFIKPMLYVPLAMAPRLRNEADLLTKRDVRWLNVKGRLKPDVTNAQAQADLNSIANALARAYPKTDGNLRMRVETELEARIEQSPPDAGLIQMLLVLALCVLLVACANVAGLLLSRASVRGREIAVRLAIGAGRWQLLRQLFVENLLLALAGGVLGIGVAYAGTALLGSIPTPTDIPVQFAVRVDQRALLFTLVVSLVSTFLFGLTPALRTTQPDVIAALKARDAELGGKGRLWGRKLLVSAQLAASLVLLIVSAILLQGFRGELAHGPGFRTDHLYLMSFDSALVHYNEDQTRLFYKQLLDKARSAPGVKSAALASAIPMSFSGSNIGIVPEGYQLPRGEQALNVFDCVVGDGYFETMRIAVLRGRGFLDSDKPNSPRVAVVNEQLANHYWPHQDALGKRFHLRTADGPLIQIVGITKTTKYVWIAEPPVDFLYLPFSQNQQSEMSLIAESGANDAATLAPVLRQVVHSIDPAMPVYDARTMKDLYTKRAEKTPNIIIQAVSGMGLMGLLLAVVGLYGLVAYSVSRRTREIGIRMAVGAGQKNVLRMVLRQGFTLAAWGIAAGILLGIFASRLVSSFTVSSFGSVSALVFVAVSIPLLIIALLATYAPARRASLIDPMRALRDE